MLAPSLNSRAVSGRRRAFGIACTVLTWVAWMAIAQSVPAQGITVAEPTLDDKATTKPPVVLDETLIHTPDWGELPREALWEKDGSVMVLIPAGEFTMGLDNPTENGGRLQEGPAHRVFVSSFYLDKYEITNAQYLDFVKRTGWIRPRITKDRNLDAPDQPVTGVTYYDVEKYAEWVGKDIPTEAQWERAARGDQMDIYPWGNEWIEGAANTKEAGYDTSLPPGSFPTDKSIYGVFDLAGNVSEWVFDWHDPDYYKESPKDDPTGPSEGVWSRVVRGGDYYYDKSNARVTFRQALPPNQSREETGFRLARSLRIEPTPTPDERVRVLFPPTPTPVPNPFAPLDAELVKVWGSKDAGPAPFTPLNIGQQSPITVINPLPVDIEISVLSDTPEVIIYDAELPALARRDLRMTIDRTMAMFIRIPDTGRVFRVDPIFQSNSRPIMVLNPTDFLPNVAEPEGPVSPPKKQPELNIYYEMPALPWNVVTYYNDAETTVSLNFAKCPAVECSKGPLKDQPYQISLGPGVAWRANMLPGEHAFEVLYLGTFDAGAGPQRITVDEGSELNAVVLRENTSTNERVRVFARMLPVIEVRILEESLVGGRRL